MGNVMIALDDEHEELLRKLAQEKQGGKKGSLTTVVQNALEQAKRSDDETFRVEFIEFLREGVKGKYKMYKHRSELYD